MQVCLKFVLKLLTLFQTSYFYLNVSSWCFSLGIWNVLSFSFEPSYKHVACNLVGGCSVNFGLFQLLAFGSGPVMFLVRRTSILVDMQ